MLGKKAILFDFDGVLADTLGDIFSSWEQAFLNEGLQITKEDYFPFEGMKVIKIAKNIAKKYDVKKDPKKILDFKNRYYLKNHSFRLYRGVEKIINEIKNKNLLIAIVSASPKEKLEKTVPKKFLEKFDTLISGDYLELGKPSPDPYLTAAKELKVLPNECLVVENAPLGIKSAKSAGMYCIAIKSTLDEKYLKEADEIIPNFIELKTVLRSILELH